MAEETTAVTSDVGAIANAATELIKFGGKVFDNITLEKNTYLGRLAEQGVPRVNDWFAGYKTDFTKQNQTIILALVALIGIVILAAAISKK